MACYLILLVWDPPWLWPIVSGQRENSPEEFIRSELRGRWFGKGTRGCMVLAFDEGNRCRGVARSDRNTVVFVGEVVSSTLEGVTLETMQLETGTRGTLEVRFDMQYESMTVYPARDDQWWPLDEVSALRRIADGAEGDEAADLLDVLSERGRSG